MKTLALVALASMFTAACATSGQGLPDRDGKRPAGPGLDLDSQSPDDADRQFPERLSRAELPAADRLVHRINAEHGGVLSTQVRLCVAPSGAVADVDLLDSSGMSEYDRAVVETVQGWQYTAYPAPEGVKVCEKLTVSYRAP